MIHKRVRWSRQWTCLLAMLVWSMAVGAARPQNAAAETWTSPWSAPTAIATQLDHAARPALVYTGDGVAHAVWETDGTLLYASRQPGEAWSVPYRLAAGTDPTLVADAAGDLHVVFANQFMGNYEIYHTYQHNGIWSLPVNVSHTSGYSAHPTLVITRDQNLHAAWMDNTPGYWTIYHGAWNGQFWSSQPVPNARGQAPMLAVGPEGPIYLTWQDHVPQGEDDPGRFDIFLSELVDRQWSLPINISDYPAGESLGAHVATTADGVAHITWVDQARRVRYCYGQGTYWSEPQTVSVAITGAHGPRITAEHGILLHIAWDEGNIIRATAAPASPATWPKGDLIATPIGSLRDVTLALVPGGGVSVGWVQTSRPGDTGIYESRQESAFHYHLWLPMWSHQ